MANANPGFLMKQEQLKAEGQKFQRLSDLQINQRIAHARMLSEKKKSMSKKLSNQE